MFTRLAFAALLVAAAAASSALAAQANLGGVSIALPTPSEIGRASCRERV